MHEAKLDRQKKCKHRYLHKNGEFTSRDIFVEEHVNGLFD